MELVEELHVMPRARAGVMESLTAAAQVSRASETIGYRSNDTSCRRRLEQCGLAWSAPAGVMRAQRRAAGITASS